MTSAIEIRDAVPDDHPRIIELNTLAVRHTSPMHAIRLLELQALSDCNWVITVDGAVAGFLLAMREHADYANLNYDYFAVRYPMFLYIDRIVIAPEHAGLKLGTRLYHCSQRHVQNACRWWYASTTSNRRTRLRAASTTNSASVKSARNGWMAAGKKFRCKQPQPGKHDRHLLDCRCLFQAGAATCFSDP